MKNIFVGNLDFNTSEEELRQMFEAHGQVDRVSIMTDRDTGRSRGFGFVEMTNGEEGDKAIAALNGTQLGGRTLNVNEARPKVERGGGGVAAETVAIAVAVAAEAAAEVGTSSAHIARLAFTPGIKPSIKLWARLATCSNGIRQLWLDTYDWIAEVLGQDSTYSCSSTSSPDLLLLGNML